MITPLLNTITEEELRFIASLDMGHDVESHLRELRAVIFEQDGYTTHDQFWFPYEVIELGAHHLQPGHEREFFFCTMLVIQSVLDGRDISTDLTTKLQIHAQNYDALPPPLRDEVLMALIRAEA